MAALFDGHVHVYDCFELDILLDAADRNFAAAAEQLGLREPHLGVLLLTESAGYHCFDELRSWSELGRSVGAWVFRRTGEDLSLVAWRDGEPRLAIIAGRQLVVAEDLEVLALGVERQIPDGLPINEALDRVRGEGGLPTVPWGFGKWWLRRGRVVARLLETEDPTQFFLGDNGGRLQVRGRPKLLEVAQRKGFRVLPGSDPLPFADQAVRVGSFGGLLEGRIGLENPSGDLKSLLTSLEARPVAYGATERPAVFLKHQVAMQLRKRFGRRAR